MPRSLLVNRGGLGRLQVGWVAGWRIAGAERSAWRCRREPLRRLAQINRVGRGEESRRLIVRIGIASQPQSAPSLGQAERRPPCRDQKDPLRQREISCSTSQWVQPLGIVALRVCLALQPNAERERGRSAFARRAGLAQSSCSGERLPVACVASSYEQGCQPEPVA